MFEIKKLHGMRFPDVINIASLLYVYCVIHMEISRSASKDP